MKQVVITADSAADLPKELAEKYDIKIMPMNVIVDGKTFRDGIDISPDDIFGYVEKNGEIPKTSAVSPGEYMDFFEPFLKAGKAVVHLSFCSELSSTHRNAKLASARLGDVYAIDTRSLAGGMALLALKACGMRDSGASAEEIIYEMQKLIPKTKVSYLLDSIEFLRRGGRCSSAVAWGANLLSVKPCAAVVNGKIDVIKKYRGKGKAVRLQYASEQLESDNIDFETAFIYHSGVPEDELSTVEEMATQAGFEQVIIAETGCMISLHSAEKAMGIHFLTK